MKARAHFVQEAVDPAAVQSATVVVIDVVRATSSMVEALAAGASAIYPTGSTEDAVNLAQSLGREDTLLCGERRGVKIEGYDLGNSPGEYGSAVVEGKRLVMSTTNGTRVFGAVAGATRVTACALTNLSAVASAVADEDDLVVVCAGRQGGFAMEDALCAGHLLNRIRQARGDALDLNDGGRAALLLADALVPDRDVLASTTGGRALIEIGLGEDLDRCAEIDRHTIVPIMVDNALTVAEE